MPTQKQGLLLDPKIIQKVFSEIERGAMNKVNALVIHQTGANTAQQTFNSYAKGGHGAHFLCGPGFLHRFADIIGRVFTLKHHPIELGIAGCNYYFHSPKLTMATHFMRDHCH